MWSTYFITHAWYYIQSRYIMFQVFINNGWVMCTSVPVTEIYYLRHWCREKMAAIFRTFWNTIYFNEKVCISIVSKQGLPIILVVTRICDCVMGQIWYMMILDFDSKSYFDKHIPLSTWWFFQKFAFLSATFNSHTHAHTHSFCKIWTRI